MKIKHGNQTGFFTPAQRSVRAAAQKQFLINNSFGKGTGFFRAGAAAIESDTTSRGSGIAADTANPL